MACISLVYIGCDSVDGGGDDGMPGNPAERQWGESVVRIDGGYVRGIEISKN